MSENLHSDILTEEQQSLLTFIKKFNKNFYLVGGTAISLYLGHRRSIDFDLFSDQRLNVQFIKSQVSRYFKNKSKKIYEGFDQLHYFIDGVKITFFEFNYNITHRRKFDECITIPSLLDLAAMKAFAFGGRGKWKDYVDIYFILKYKFKLIYIIKRAEKIFTNEFNGKLFVQQLSYFDDISYTEEVDYLKEEPTIIEIKNYLVKTATTFKFY
jgi:hypothetical protein